MSLVACPPDDGLVTVTQIWVCDASSGRWQHDAVREWPEEYWAEQSVEDGCNEYEVIWYIEREGVCYGVDGLCEGWQDDPLVTVCSPDVESCCDEAACPLYL